MIYICEPEQTNASTVLFQSLFYTVISDNAELNKKFNEIENKMEIESHLTLTILNQLEL